MRVGQFSYMKEVLKKATFSNDPGAASSVEIDMGERKIKEERNSDVEEGAVDEESVSLAEPMIGIFIPGSVKKEIFSDDQEADCSVEINIREKTIKEKRILHDEEGNLDEKTVFPAEPMIVLAEENMDERNADSSVKLEMGEKATNMERILDDQEGALDKEKAVPCETVKVESPLDDYQYNNRTVTNENMDIIKQEVFIKQEPPANEDEEVEGENWTAVEQQPVVVESAVINETTVEERLFLAGPFKVEYPAHDFEFCGDAHAKIVSVNDDEPVFTIRVEKREVQVDRLCETQENSNNEGNRSTAMAATFICFASVHDPSSWKQSDIDSCLTAGSLLNAATLKKLDKGNTYLLTLPDQRKVLFDVQTNDEIHGTLDKNCSEPSFPSYEISEGLCELFFGDYNAGILTTNNSSIGIFRRGDFIWLFDSHERDRNRYSHFDGKSMLLQFSDVKCAANHVQELYNGSGSFVITPIAGIKLLKEERYDNSFIIPDIYSMIEGPPNRSNNKKEKRERFSKKKQKREQLKKARMARLAKRAQACSTTTNSSTEGVFESNKETVNNGSILDGNNLKQLCESNEADSCSRRRLQRKTPISRFKLHKEDRHNNKFITPDGFSMRKGPPNRSNNKKEKRDRFSKKKQKREQLKKARMARLAKRACSTITNSNAEGVFESNKETVNNGSILDGNNLKKLSEIYESDSCSRHGLQRKTPISGINRSDNKKEKRERFSKKKRKREQLMKARMARMAKRACSAITNSNTEEDFENNRGTADNGSILDGNNLKQLNESYEADSCSRRRLQRKTPFSGIKLPKEDRHNNWFITPDGFSMRDEPANKSKKRREQLKMVRMAKRACSTITNSNTEEDLESNKETMKNGSILDGNNLKQLSESDETDSYPRRDLQMGGADPQ